MVLVNQENMLILFWLWNCSVDIRDFLIESFVCLLAGLFESILLGQILRLLQLLLNYWQSNCVRWNYVDRIVCVVLFDRLEKSWLTSCRNRHWNKHQDPLVCVLSLLLYLLWRFLTLLFALNTLPLALPLLNSFVFLILFFINVLTKLLIICNLHELFFGQVFVFAQNQKIDEFNWNESCYTFCLILAKLEGSLSNSKVVLERLWRFKLPDKLLDLLTILLERLLIRFFVLLNVKFKFFPQFSENSVLQSLHLTNIKILGSVLLSIKGLNVEHTSLSSFLDFGLLDFHDDLLQSRKDKLLLILYLFQSVLGMLEAILLE